MRRSKLFTVIAMVVLICGMRARADIGGMTKIGNPQWQPAGFVLFSAPIGTASDGFAEFNQSLQDVLPSPNYQFNPNNDEIAPGYPHQDPGPYDTEMAADIAASGFKTGPTFNVSDFSNGNGVFFGFMFVPTSGAPSGSSPDYAKGPIIPNSLFNFTQTGDTQRDGAEFDPNWSVDYGDVNSVLQGLTTTTFDGFSHIPILEAEAAEFGPSNTDPIGSYSSAWTITDQNGNGWTVTTSYTVVPEPTGAALFAGSSLMLIRRRFRVGMRTQVTH